MISLKVLIFVSFALTCIVGATHGLPHPQGQGGCPDVCPYNYNPQCGFNGNCYRQFSNECDLVTTNCRSSGAFRQVNLGMCNNPSNRMC